MTLRRAWTLLRRLVLLRAQEDRDLDDELAFHIAEEARLRIDRGASPADAVRAARLAFGNVTFAKEETRGVWVSGATERLFQDLRFGFRIVTGAPLLLLSAVTLVALVIGGNTTVYSIARAILNKPAPGVRAENLVTVSWIRKDGFIEPETSYANYQDLAAQSRSLGPMLAYQYVRVALGHENGSNGIWAAGVSANYFQTLEVPIVIGRGFTADEDQRATSGLPMVISDRAWREYFAAAPSAVGAAVLISGLPATIVGVAAPDFRGTQLAPSVDAWVPIVPFARAAGGADAFASRQSNAGVRGPLVGNFVGVLAQLAERLVADPGADGAHDALGTIAVAVSRCVAGHGRRRPDLLRHGGRQQPALHPGHDVSRHLFRDHCADAGDRVRERGESAPRPRHGAAAGTGPATVPGRVANPSRPHADRRRAGDSPAGLCGRVRLYAMDDGRHRQPHRADGAAGRVPGHRRSGLGSGGLRDAAGAHQHGGLQPGARGARLAAGVAAIAQGRRAGRRAGTVAPVERPGRGAACVGGVADHQRRPRHPLDRPVCRRRSRIRLQVNPPCHGQHQRCRRGSADERGPDRAAPRPAAGLAGHRVRFVLDEGDSRGRARTSASRAGPATRLPPRSISSVPTISAPTA